MPLGSKASITTSPPPQGHNGSGGTRSTIYDDEARNLWKRLGLPSSAAAPSTLSSSVLSSGYSDRRFSNMDPIFTHPTTGGTIFVGNQNAAATLPLLKQHKITHVVNCTNGFGAIENFHEGQLRYFRFPISDWEQHVNRVGMPAFVEPLFAFIDSALESGSNVLVHCLAGAHRAGTTGCACLIHYGNLDCVTAVRTAKSLRPIIDPICDFPRFLKRFEEHRQQTRRN